MRAVGFEPTQISLTELKTVALNWGYYPNHSAKLASVDFSTIYILTEVFKPFLRTDRNPEKSRPYLETCSYTTQYKHIPTLKMERGKLKQTA